MKFLSRASADFYDHIYPYSFGSICEFCLNVPLYQNCMCACGVCVECVVCVVWCVYLVCVWCVYVWCVCVCVCVCGWCVFRVCVCVVCGFLNLFIYCMLHHYSDTTCTLTILLYNFLACIVQLYLQLASVIKWD
jgi:hypothetical protein